MQSKANLTTFKQFHDQQVKYGLITRMIMLDPDPGPQLDLEVLMRFVYCNLSWLVAISRMSTVVTSWKNHHALA